MAPKTSLPTTTKLDRLRAQLATPPKPARLLALKKQLGRKAKKVQLRPGMHRAGDFVDAVSMGMSDKFPFGKYKGKTLRHIVNNDAMWLVWIIDQMGDKLHLNSEVMSQIEMFIGSTPDDPAEGDDVTLAEMNGLLEQEF